MDCVPQDTEASFRRIRSIRYAYQSLRCLYLRIQCMAIFVLTAMMTTWPIALSFAHACRVIKVTCTLYCDVQSVQLFEPSCWQLEWLYEWSWIQWTVTYRRKSKIIWKCYTNWMGHLTQSNKGVTSSMWGPRLPPTIEGLYRTGEILPQSEHLCSFQCSKIVLINDYRGWSPSATSLPCLVLCPAPLNFIWMLIILHMQNHRDYIVYQSPLHLIGTRLIIILLL